MVVYRRENEFAGWPHTMGWWNLGNGELLQQVTSIDTDYGSADAISHDNIGRGGSGKSVALRSNTGATGRPAAPILLTSGQPATLRNRATIMRGDQ